MADTFFYLPVFADVGGEVLAHAKIRFVDLGGGVFAPLLNLGKTGDGTYQVPELDPITHAQITVDIANHKAHEGSRFFLHEGFVLNSGATGSKEYLITTPDSSKWAHMTINVKGSLIFSLRFFEGTGKTAGTPMVGVDHNRNTANTPTTIITHTPTGSEGSGLVLFTSRHGHPTLFGGRGGEGGEGGGRDAITLKKNEKYSLLVTALSANDTNMTVDIDWFEHTSKAA